MLCFLQCAENTKFLVRASYLEIYNEDVRDLLGADTKQKLEVGAEAMWGGEEDARGEASIRWCWDSGSCCSVSLVLGPWTNITMSSQSGAF